MMKKQLPCFYFPTKIALLDDSQSFLESLEMSLPDEAIYQIFDNPHLLIEFVNNTVHPEDITKRCFQKKEEVSLTETMLSLDISELYKEIYNPKRFELLSVIVSDYAMPGLNGVEVCKRLNDYPLRKILLTGEVGTDLAVEAFNAGFIDQFLLKDSPDFVAKLNRAIEVNQQQFFNAQTTRMLHALTKTAKDTLSCLMDPVFIEFLRGLIKEYDIVEYYLLDGQGSFLMLDKQANVYWLVVKNEAEMNELIRYAKFEDASDTLVNQLSARSHAPCLFTTKELQTPPGMWANFMHPVTELSGQQRYYYTLINDPHALKRDKDKIVSFADFLAENE